MKVDQVVPPSAGELLVVVGATASGKTELAIRLAERFDGEIVSADSVQIYRSFDVGSGKPTPAEVARAPHHLVGAVDPMDAMDAARFAALADEAIAEVRRSAKTAIVCGGTYLWIKALLEGLAEGAPRDDELRAKHAEVAKTEGRAALHERLRAIDPASAERLAPNDFIRVSRALEVHELTGRTMTDWHAEHAQRRTKRYPARLLSVARERADVDARIGARVHRWLDAGWIEEVEGLLAAGYRQARAMGSVGYRDVCAFIDGALSRQDLPEAIIRSTRIFARRQRTWLRDEDVVWIDPEP